MGRREYACKVLESGKAEHCPGRAQPEGDKVETLVTVGDACVDTLSGGVELLESL
jgi:hypothetical protein